MQHLLDEIAFRDRNRAAADLTRLSAVLPVEASQRVQVLLGSCADPDAALRYLERLREEQEAAFDWAVSSPGALQFPIAVFSTSRFLSEEVLQHPEWLDSLPASGNLHRVLTAEELTERLERFLGGHFSKAPSPLALALFRRQQILRILVRDVLGFAALPEITEELSNLADAILEVTCRRIRGELTARYGCPRYEDAEGKTTECGFTVMALGKLGGRELNYSSDIDLMFLHSGNGQTDGPERISNREFFKKVANQLTDLLSTYTAEGMCYRVDLRLRPDGRLGEVCISLDGAKNYYDKRGRDWELQMLIKARCAAGERELCRELLEFVEPLIYASTLDFSAVESVSVTRERISEKLAARRKGPDEFDIKLARGGIRDIEFLVQCLQRLHGARERWVRHGGTLLALFRLRAKNLLSDSEYSRLASAYQFLRHLEHRLQVVDDRQTHTLPKDPDELDLLARRMPASEIGAEANGEALLRRLNAHLESVQEIYERVIHAQQPMYYSQYAPAAIEPDEEDPDEASLPDQEPPPASNLVRFLDQKAPGLAATLSRSRLRRGYRLFEHFLEKVLANAEWTGWLDADPVLAGYSFDLFEHSPYFSEQLVRRPELISELRRMRKEPGIRTKYSDMVSMLGDAADLRRFFRREMLRIQSESICLPLPVFPTLQRTSELADAVVAAAYQMAIEEVSSRHPPADSAYTPKRQMVVIALGRLGMQEFDLASDADLVFVIPDRDGSEHRFWTRVAERVIHIVTAYTGEGVMFAVDTRLRPNGREGALVQTESSYKDYFARTAEAWEGITYMKSRAVAGDTERATEFLNELQEVDWRRYGQSGRSQKKLWEMRMRLEKEQGGANPLKAGYGGYYDIDFALMYLRLKGAGMFYKVLNSPARIDVIEKMGHLERADAEFLRDAATFYRAVDHGLRLWSGQAEGSLPHTHAQLEALTELVCRWTPEHLHDQPLNIELAQIQARTREYFERLFG